MKQIVVFGAGHSTPFLIERLLDRATALEAQIIVADRDIAAAETRISGHPRGEAVAFDVTSTSDRDRLLAKADLAIHLLPPAFQPLIAESCLKHGTHMLSASYRSRDLRRLHETARQRGVMILCEMGLDPGIDLITAASLLDRIRQRGGIVDRLESYGGGLPAPREPSNPLRYFTTWNPRNVVMAGESGAEYLLDGRTKIVPWHRLFSQTWPVEVPGLGALDAYPNRDSLAYRELLSLEQAHTLIRGTLRYPGFCTLWHQLVRLGLPNEEIQLHNLTGASLAEMLEMFLPATNGHGGRGSLRSRAAAFLGLAENSESIEQMEWLGLFSEHPVDPRSSGPASALVYLLQERLSLSAESRDMVVLFHELHVSYPQENRRERIRSTFIELGEAGGMTAMARTVGLPLSIGAELLIKGELDLAGCHIPIREDIYQPVLDRLRAEGLEFPEEVETLPARRESPASQ